MDFTYYVKLFRTGTDRHNGILMSRLLLVAETITILDPDCKMSINSKIVSAKAGNLLRLHLQENLHQDALSIRLLVGL